MCVLIMELYNYLPINIYDNIIIPTRMFILLLFIYDSLCLRGVVIPAMVKNEKSRHSSNGGDIL